MERNEFIMCGNYGGGNISKNIDIHDIEVAGSVT
jgi:hypothetical protein